MLPHNGGGLLPGLPATAAAGSAGILSDADMKAVQLAPCPHRAPPLLPLQRVDTTNRVDTARARSLGAVSETVLSDVNVPSFWPAGEAVTSRSIAKRNVFTTAAPSRRASSGSSASSTEEGADHGPPKHIALLFLFNAIIFGTMIAQLLTSIPMLHGLQQTVIVFASGVIYSLLLEGLGWNEGVGVFGQSYDMWMSIDPHLLLFTMLPPLLAGDAMTMDTAIARKVSKQWLYLAGPGVLINAFCTALFLYVYLPYEWPFLLCLVTGAILCATDPVAVVALLRELGAPPTLTVQIQGESLLNDGTAIVLYQLAFRMLNGETFDVSDILMFVMRMAAGAWGLGLMVGWLFYFWITSASSKLFDHASVVQISLSLCCAYWSFIIAEGVFHISGVLATVAASLVLADKMWPVLVSKESMHTVWEMLEFIGNIIVFFLAGALTGNLMVHMPGMDYIHLLVIYAVLVFIRGGMLVASRPVMNYFGARNNPPIRVSFADCLVMTWGGLRGAVGLALAIQVTIDKPGKDTTVMDANRVLFYVGGVAALTLAINATTCPMLVKVLGVTALPETKARVLLMVQEQLFWLLDSKTELIGRSTPAMTGLKHTLDHISKWIEEHSANSKRSSQGSELKGSRSSGLSRVSEQSDALQSTISRTSMTSLRRSINSTTIDAQAASSRTSRSMKDLKEEMEMRIAAEDASVAEGVADRGSLQSRKSRGSIHEMRTSLNHLVKSFTAARTDGLSSHEDISKMMAEVKEKFRGVTRENLRLLGDLPDMPTEAQEAEIMEIIANERHEDTSMVRALKEVFLNLVNAQYWELIDAGEVVPGTSEAEVLLSSIKLARGSTETGLSDFQHICVAIYAEVQKMTRDQSTRIGDDGRINLNEGRQIEVGWLVDSAGFNACVMIAIFSNAVFIGCEENLRSQTSRDQAELGWILADLTFTVVFFLEFVLKFLSLRMKYFSDSWNVLDFVLVVMSIFSNVLSFIVQESQAQGTDVAAESRLLRLARVFRIMRLMRLFRMIHFVRVVKAKLIRREFSTVVAKHVQTITVLICFVKAHVHSQREILLYFGTDKKVDISELARCIIESQVQTYKAMALAVDSVQQLDNTMLKEVNCQKKSKQLAEQLDKLVHHAHRHNVITARDAQSVLHPVRAHLKEMEARIREMHFGYIRTTPSSHEGGGRERVGAGSVSDERVGSKGWDGLMCASESELVPAYSHSESGFFQSFPSEACSEATSAAWGTSQAVPLHLGSERPGYKRSGSDITNRSGSEKQDDGMRREISAESLMDSSGGLEDVSEVAAFGGGATNVGGSSSSSERFVGPSKDPISIGRPETVDEVNFFSAVLPNSNPDSG